MNLPDSVLKLLQSQLKETQKELTKERHELDCYRLAVSRLEASTAQLKARCLDIIAALDN